MVGRDFDLRRVNSENLSLKITETRRNDYSHIFRKKTSFDFLRLSAGVMGIEFAYAVETAFVSPILLELGIEHDKMTLVWALSPLLGLVLAPFLGSISDRCKSKLGRRRPLIFFLCLGIFIGLILVPYGKDIGLLLGDTRISNNVSNLESVANMTTSFGESVLNKSEPRKLPMIAVILTIFGTVLMDFDADVCQSPIRTYLLEVCVPEDHAKGLSIFTVMTGVGGFLGYVIGGVDWNALVIGTWLGGNIKTVFKLIIIIFTTCIAITLTSFREIPLADIKSSEDDTEVKLIIIPDIKVIGNSNGQIGDSKVEPLLKAAAVQYDNDKTRANERGEKPLTISKYCKSLTSMPSSMRVLFLTNLLTWMSHLSYSLYFTDFVGECVYGGDPAAALGTPELDMYNQGVRFGCWGLAIYCLACAAYSTIIDWLIKSYRAKTVFIGGLLFFSSGMTTLVLVRTKMAVLLLSITSGVAYSTLSTIPYLILAQYHTKGTFGNDADSSATPPRGLGLDMAIIGSTIFLAQLSLSLGLGWLIQLGGGSSAVIWTAAILSLFAAISATQVTYLDL